MAQKWNALEQAPESGSIDDKIQWLVDQVAAYRLLHPDLPKGDWHSLSRKQQRLIVKNYNRAREAAQVEQARKTNPKLADVLERAHRTGVISTRSRTKVKPPQRRKPQ